MQKYLFIDRDGTIIESPPSPLQVNTIEEVVFLPEVVKWLSKIAIELDYKLVMVTNQNGLGSEEYPEDNFIIVQNFMLEVLAKAKIIFEDIIVDDSYPHEKSDLRKPRIGRMNRYLQNEEVDMQNTFVIGDRLTDIQFAKNLGCKGIFVNPENIRGASELTDDIDDLKIKYTSLSSTEWEDVYEFLKVQ